MHVRVVCSAPQRSPGKAVIIDRSTRLLVSGRGLDEITPSKDLQGPQASSMRYLLLIPLPHEFSCFYVKRVCPRRDCRVGLEHGERGGSDFSFGEKQKRRVSKFDALPSSFPTGPKLHARVLAPLLYKSQQERCWEAARFSKYSWEGDF